MAKKYNWATIGTGVIANELAQALIQQGRNLYSVANRTHENGVNFAKKYGIEKVYDKIDDVFEDENVDVIYISTPHNTHIEFVRKALMAKKHVLCEKSITLNSDELNEAISLAKENDVVFAEAMTIYHMPLYKQIEKYIEEKELGSANVITMNFGSYKEYDMTNRFFSRNLAGGALLDIGVYALSFTRLFLDSKPEEIMSFVKKAPTGVDENASIILKNKEEQMATIMLSLHTKQPKRGTVCFDKGYLEVFEYPRGRKAVFTYTDDGHKEEIEPEMEYAALGYEILDMEKSIEENKDYMHMNYTEDVMDIMTELRKSWGITYPEEEK